MILYQRASMLLARPRWLRQPRRAVAAALLASVTAFEAPQAMAAPSEAARPKAPAPVSRPLAHCFNVAAQRYQVSPWLLAAIAHQESSMNPRAFNRNTNGSEDIGLMQINSSWLPLLARHGIAKADLWEPCTNIMVGAWILGGNIARLGPTLNALGAYNARDPVKRERYARQVLQRLSQLPAPPRSAP